MREAARLQWPPISATAHKGLTVQPHSQREQLFCLLPLEASKFISRECRKGDCAASAGLCVFEPQLVSCLFQALNNSQDPAIEIDVLPPQCEEFATAHSGRDRDHH